MRLSVYLYPAAKSFRFKVATPNTDCNRGISSDSLNTITSEAGVLALVVRLQVVDKQVAQRVSEREVVVPEGEFQVLGKGGVRRHA